MKALFDVFCSGASAGSCCAGGDNQTPGEQFAVFEQQLQGQPSYGNGSARLHVRAPKTNRAFSIRTPASSRRHKRRMAEVL